MKFLSTIIFCLAFSVGYAQSYSAGNLGELEDAIIDAVNYAETNDATATITINAGALIEVNHPLPLIDHYRGKVIIKAESGDPDPEGLKGVASLSWEDDIRRGLVAVNCGDLEVLNLEFEDFVPVVVGGSLKGTSVYCHNVESIYVNGCSFTNSGYGVFVAYHNGNLNNTVDIYNNVFVDDRIGVYVVLRRTVNTGPQGDYYPFSDDYTGDLVKIRSNDMDDCRVGIITQTMEEDIYANFEITGNTINGDGSIDFTHTHGMVLYNCRKGYYTVTNNTVDNYTFGIALSAHYGSLDESNFGINFVESGNTAGYTPENIDNTITNCQRSFRLNTDNFEFNIVNLIVEGEIYVSGNYPSSLRENIIKKSGDAWYDGFTFFPIELHSDGGIVDGNQNIPSPTPISAIDVGGTVELTYSISGLDPANAPFVVEFFEVEPNLSVVEYLGNESVLTADDVILTESFSPGEIADGNHVGVTITSIGPDLTNKIGTSELSATSIQELDLPCENCEKFSPIPGERYWISAWVYVEKEDQVKSYENVSLQLMAYGGGAAIATGTPTGEIIDGWQRIVVDFTIPETAEYFKLRLNSDPSDDTYFDDIRIHPFNGSMKSYVYDGETFWLTSELDDNNYATFYEYDEEGGLIRIKKETSRGIVTIQETRSNTVKQDN